MTSTPPPPTASRLRYRRTTRWFRPVTVVEVLDDSASDWIDAWGQPRRAAPASTIASRLKSIFLHSPCPAYTVRPPTAESNA